MSSFHTTQDQSVLVEHLFELERAGLYEEALSELDEIWLEKNTFPRIDDFEPHAGAEILLRAGSLIGCFEHVRKIPDSQEISKNLLTKARRKFSELGNMEKVAECEDRLALAYWRTGALFEAYIWIESALSHNLPDSSFAKLNSLITKSFILLKDNKNFEIIRLLSRFENCFLIFGDDLLKGYFYDSLGMALTNLNEPNKALEHLKLARQYLILTGHRISIASVENNIAFLHNSTGEYEKAHQAADKAIKLFGEIGYETKKAFALDTKAQIFYGEERFHECLLTIEKAIEKLKVGENFVFLVETLQTKIKTLIALDDIFSATNCLIETVQIAGEKISEKAAENVNRSFESAIRKFKTVYVKNVYGKPKTKLREHLPQKPVEDELKLILPPSLSNYQEYQAVWINNSKLKKYGIKKGYLALIASISEKVDRGDLVAVSDKDDLVVCGIYDKDFGIICLEKPGNEPQLFDENEVKVLGKIIGYGKPEKENPNEVRIKSINLN